MCTCQRPAKTHHLPGGGASSLGPAENESSRGRRSTHPTIAVKTQHLSTIADYRKGLNMSTAKPPLTQLPVWQALANHYRTIKDAHLRDLFARDPERGRRLAVEGAGIYLDYSKNRVTDETLRLLVALAEAAGLRERIDAMFRGEKINVTEKRSVLHVALRAPGDAHIVVDGRDVVPEVHAVLDKMAH